MKITRNQSFLLAACFILFSVFIFIDLYYYRKDEQLLSSGKSLDVITDSVFTHLQFKHGYTYQTDTFCSYIYNAEYQLIVWKIGKYSDVVLSNNLTSFVNINPEFHIIAYSELDTCRGLKIVQRQIKKAKTKLKIGFNKKSRIIQNKSNVDFYAVTDGFQIGYPYQKHIVFDFKEDPKEINMTFRKVKNQFILIVLYPLDKKQLGGNILKNILIQN